MHIGLFIPCYVDQLYPRVGKAALSLLARLGHSIEVPSIPRCCGQPMSNSGYAHLSEAFHRQFAAQCAAFDHVVVPSGSCALHLREALEHHHPSLASRVLELCEFLHDVAQVESLPGKFPHRVGLHHSCHGLRGLGLGTCSESLQAEFSKPARLLALVEGLRLVPLDRNDECCGFGGTFAMFESEVSVAMGRDRVRDHLRHGAEFITSVDMSCLMHLGGLLSREAPQAKVVHIAEIMAGTNGD